MHRLQRARTQIEYAEGLQSSWYMHRLACADFLWLDHLVLVQ